MNRPYPYLGALIVLVMSGATGCKADKCEELAAQAQIDITSEGMTPHGIDVTITLNSVKEFKLHFDVPAPTFVFKFENWDRAPRAVIIYAVAYDAAGKKLGSGSTSTTFSSDGCNFFEVVMKPGTGPDAGVDGAAPDAAPEDGPAADVAPEDGPAADVAEPDAAAPDAALPDAASPDLPAPDAMTDMPATDGMTDMPATDGMTDLPTTDGMTDLPTTDGMTDLSTTDGMTDLSSTDQLVADQFVSDLPLTDGGDPAPGTWVTLPPAGTPVPVTFSMGSPADENCRLSNESEHPVTLTHFFEISIYEVTQDEFLAVMGYNNSSFPCDSACPVEMVTWYEAAAYCNALSSMVGLTPCYSCSGAGTSVICDVAAAYDGTTQSIYDCPGFRLPTDAEWEYAYRAGSSTPLYPSAGNDGSIIVCSGGNDTNADMIGWYSENANDYAHPVGQMAPNAWGLYDMAGNVWEWCHDWLKSNLGTTLEEDPWGPDIGSKRVIRGGSWLDPQLRMRAASRDSYAPSYLGSTHGFRPCRTLNP